ncbi:hypothetical protein [Angelakisella massiliensis]|uniref:hypothetical protein n=1 Tax=Angelakisella massiliensis TaxID=1871018 RepID=UPI0024B1C8D0|nr:hypothetical protein [Angelakisella massiliensis]
MSKDFWRILPNIWISSFYPWRTDSLKIPTVRLELRKRSNIKNIPLVVPAENRQISSVPEFAFPIGAYYNIIVFYWGEVDGALPLGTASPGCPHPAAEVAG